VHDSILADVAENEVAYYSERAVYYLQRDRGVYIPHAPIGCDVDVADDYSLGKFEKTYMNAA